MTERIELDVIDPAVECTDCGLCCSEMNSPPFSGVVLPDGTLGIADPCYPDDYERLMSAPEEAKALWLNDNRPDGSPCCWLDPVKKQCRWHEFRPDICRDFAVGGESCKVWRNPELRADELEMIS